MRVLHVTEVSTGGVPSVVNAFAQWQTDAGYEVHVLTPADATVVAGTRHVWDPSRRRPHRFPAAVRALNELTAELEPDVVHLHSFFPGILGRIGRRHGPDRPAIVYQPHSWAFDAAPTPLGRPLVAAWERFAARRTDMFIVNCEDERREGERHRVKMSAHVVGVPIDTDHFVRPTDEARRRTRAELEVGARTVFTCVGRISRQKGQDRLVAVWRQAPVAGAVLVLVGGGDQSRVQQLAGDEWGRSVLATGAVDDVRPWLHAADLCVAPSRWEGQAVALAEGMACGVPFVASHVNGVHEALIAGPEHPAGVVVDQDDMTAFLMACRRRTTETELRDAEGVAARARAERMFATDGVMQRVTAAYQAATDARARPSSRVPGDRR